MFFEPPVKTERDAPTTASPQAPNPAAPLPPPLPNATASSSASAPLVWPAGSGLVFYWDPRTALARRTYQGLMNFTKGTLVSTQWIDEATHVLIDVNKSLTSRDREYYKGKLILNLEWARDSAIEGGPKDVNDENYQVVWEEDGRGGARDSEVVEVAKRKGKKKARKEVRRASTEELGGEEDSSSGDDKPLYKRPAPVRGSAGRWTEEENLDFARYMAAYPNPNWGRYHDSHPSRSLSAIDQHYYHKRAVIDPLIQKIKKEANGRPVVYVHPKSTSTSSSRPNPPPPPPQPSNNDDLDDSDRSSGDKDHHIAQPSSSNLHSHAADANAPRLVPSSSGCPCLNCKCDTSTSWHRLKGFDTGDPQFCSSCRAVFYQSSKKRGFVEGKQALARRRERVLGPDASDLDSSDDDQPRRITTNHASSSARHSLPNTTTTSSSHHHQPSSHHRSSLPGPSTSSYLAPPPSHKRARSSNEDVDPRLEKRRRKLAKMGASAPSSSYASTSYNPPPPSNTHSHQHRLPSSSPSPAPAPNPFLLIGTKPSSCTTNRWCWVCGSDSSSRYSKINLREMGEGRVVCGECSAWRKERRREEMSEEELVELTRQLRRRGDGIRRGVVEG